MTTTAVIEAIPPANLDQVRSAGRDGAGNPFTPFESGQGGEPLRCCLRMARAGERVALIAYQPPGGAGAYHEAGPVFVHAEPCDGYPQAEVWPPEFRDRLQVLRGYDRAGRMVHAVLVHGSEAERTVAFLLADPDVAVVQSRNVMQGCFMFALRRPGPRGARPA